MTYENVEHHLFHPPNNQNAFAIVLPLLEQKCRPAIAIRDGIQDRQLLRNLVDVNERVLPDAGDRVEMPRFARQPDLGLGL